MKCTFIGMVLRYQQRLCFSSSRFRLQHNAATVAQTNVTTKSPSLEWHRARSFADIPTESSFGMLRHFLPSGRYYKRDAASLMEALRTDYGDIFYMPKMLGKPAILYTHNPSDFEAVLRNEGIWPVRPGNDVLKYHRSVHRRDFFQGVEGTIVTQDHPWGTFRSTVNPVLMQPKNVKLYVHKMSQVNKEFIELIKKLRDPNSLEMPDDFQQIINRWTMESISVVALDKQLGLLGEKYNDPEMLRLFANLSDFFELMFELEFKPSPWKYVATPAFKRFMKVLDNILTLTVAHVNEAIERLDKRGNQHGEGEKSVLEKLLSIDKKIAVVMALDMLMAGVDTTATVFTGTMLCLAKNPEKQAKLRAEIMQVLPHKDSEFSEESLNKIPYLRACIKEALRVYPVTFGNLRVPQNDVVLSGYQVPKGTQVAMVHQSLVKDDSFFPRAAEFLPERWLRGNKLNSSEVNSLNDQRDLKASSPFVYLPFGFGPRSCIGKRIVELELELGVARIIRHFNVEFNYPTENAFKSLIINVPNIPLKFKLTDLNE